MALAVSQPQRPIIHTCRSQAARAQRKAETYRRRMAALGQPVAAAEPSPAYAPAFQQPYQDMYQDPYAAAPGYGEPQYAPEYPSYAERAFPAEAALAGALQWEMPQVCPAETSPNPPSRWL